MQEHDPVYVCACAYTYMQCGQHECYCASHLDCPGWRRRAGPWVHAVPRAGADPFPSPSPCLFGVPRSIPCLSSKPAA